MYSYSYSILWESYIIPCGQCESIHGTALVIEDAETMGALLSRVESRAQVSQLMMAYEDIRQPRCVRTYKHHQYLDAIMKCPMGSQQDSRDYLLRQTLAHEDWDVSGFQAMFGDHLTSFTYDATEAVEDWWTSRGLLNKDTPFLQSPLQVWITQE